MQKVKNIKKIAIFIADEGFGHTVRQRSIIEELLRNNKKIYVEVITSKKILLLKEKFGDRINYNNHHNLIETKKNIDGSLNLTKTLKMFKDWKLKKENWLNIMEKKYKNFNLIISDGVPQAFELSKILKIQNLNISYFTWDWFFNIHFNKEKNKNYEEIFNCIRSCYIHCEHFLTLPFTPINRNFYKRSKFSKIDFIVDKDIYKKKSKTPTKRIKCLIMDNGTKTMESLIDKSLPYLAKIKDINFFVGSKSLQSSPKRKISTYKNLFPVIGLKKMHQTISNSDFLIGRAGYNTISESLYLSKPTMLFHEYKNYETLYNLNILLKKKLTARISSNDFGKNIIKRIYKFLRDEKNVIEKKYKNYTHSRMGSLQARQIILKSLNKNHNLHEKNNYNS